MTIEEQAQNKLQRIIQLEGDANGERLKPYYLQALISEIEQQQEVSKWLFDNYKTKGVKNG